MVAADFEQEQSIGLGVRWYVFDVKESDAGFSDYNVSGPRGGRRGSYRGGNRASEQGRSIGGSSGRKIKGEEQGDGEFQGKIYLVLLTARKISSFIIDLYRVGMVCVCVCVLERPGGRAVLKNLRKRAETYTTRQRVHQQYTWCLLEITQVHALTAMEFGGGKCCEDLKDLSIRNTRFHFAHEHLHVCKCVCVGVCSRAQDNRRTQ